MKNNSDSEEKNNGGEKNLPTKQPDKPSKEAENQEVDDFVEKMPPEMKRIIQSFSMRAISGVHNPIYNKINEEHIAKIIQYSRDDEQDNYNLKRTNRYFTLGYTILAVAIFIFLIIFLMPRDMELLTEILKVLVLVGAGIGGGIGIKSYLEKRE